MKHIKMKLNTDADGGHDGMSFYRQAVAQLSDGGGNRTTKWRIKEWKPIYTKVVVMLQRGMTVAQIAAEAEIGYTVKQIGMLIRDPLFRLKMTQYNRKLDAAIIERATEDMTKFPEVFLAQDRIAESSEAAANVLVELMNPHGKMRKLSVHDRRLMASIAQDILNRAGLKTVSTTEEGRDRKEYSPEEIQSALNNARELEAIAGRLDKRGSSYVLTGEDRVAAEETAALDPTAAVAPEGVPVETIDVEQTVANPDLAQPPS